MKLNKVLSSLSFLIVFTQGIAMPLDAYCGYFEEYGDSYYAIINQRMLVDARFEPFLNCPDQPFCGVAMDSIDLNSRDWLGYLGSDFTSEDIDVLLYNRDKSWFESITKGIVKDALSRKLTTQKHAFFIKYMLLAKQAEYSRSDGSKGSGWYQGEDSAQMNNAHVLEQALQLIKQAPDAFMRHRLGFQAVRAAHYSQQNEQAVALFKAYFSDGIKDYMYYRALEQMAGAAFNSGYYAQAIAGFLPAFEFLQDRRYINALNLKVTYAAAQNRGGASLSSSFQEEHLFFQSFFNTGSSLDAMQQLVALNPNSPYLQLLAARKLDQLQHQQFAHSYDYNGSYYVQTAADEADENPQFLELITQLLSTNKVRFKEPFVLLKAMLELHSAEHNTASKTLAGINKSSAYYSDAVLLGFIVRTQALENLDVTAINALFLEIDAEPLLHDNKALASAFFNHVAMLYYNAGDLITNSFVHVDYTTYEDSYSWEQLKSSAGYSYQLDSKHPFMEPAIIAAFEKNIVNLKNPTSFELLIVNRMKFNPADFSQDLSGTYQLTLGNLKAASAHFNKVTNPQALWGKRLRPELFSSSIKEWMNTDFSSISDNMHLKYKTLLGSSFEQENLEIYTDNKVQLVELLQKLEIQAQKDPENASDYYYMLGNVWYNMSAEGWFVNNLYYIGNNQRTDLAGYSWDPQPLNARYQQVINRASDYYKKAVQASGSKETKAKALFCLAKTNRCFDTSYNRTTRNYTIDLCGDHTAYFEILRKEYSDTAYYNQILKECSWF